MRSLTCFICFSALAIELRKDPVGSFGNPAGCTPDMLRGSVYDLPAETRNLPKFEQLTPSGMVCANTLNIPSRQFLAGIPGVTTRIEWFAIDYVGDFWIETPGAYMFTLASDDGSALYIDGKQIIDNDGQHAMTELGGRAKLEVGKHRIRVSFYQGPREYLGLVLRVAPPNGIFDFFDMRAYRPPVKALAALPAESLEEARPILRRATGAHDPLAAKAYEVSALAVMGARPAPHDFEFRAKAYRFRKVEDGTQLAITLEVPASGLKAVPGIRLVMVALVKDAQGKAVHKISEDFAVDIPAERAASLGTAALRLTRLVTLPAGKFTIEAAAVDRQASRSTVVTLEVDNSATASTVGVSDLMLVRRVEPLSGAADAADPMQFENRRVVPELAGSAPSDPSVYFVIYPSQKLTEKAKIVIELSVDGQVLGRQTSALPEPGASGAIPLTIAPPAKPGKNRLRIIIQQGSESVERVLDYAVARAN